MAFYVTQCEGSGNLSFLLEFLLPEYARCLGGDVFYGIDCTVYNDLTAEAPRFFYGPPAAIRLQLLDGLTYWAPAIYQLTHELFHLAVYCRNGWGRVAYWLEEPLAEAVSFYFLDYAASNWSSCVLSMINSSFASNIRAFLDDLLDESQRTATGGLASASTPAALVAYERAGYHTTAREGHARERLALYRAIREAPHELRYLLDYPRYLAADGVTLRSGDLYRAAPCSVVGALAAVSPVKYP